MSSLKISGDVSGSITIQAPTTGPDIAIDFPSLGGEIVTTEQLAASTGSTLIGTIQTGTGAVARTVDAKLKETVSVKDFGAVGDGVTDDTAAIQAAYNYIGQTRGVLYFPEGVHICSGLDLGIGELSCTFQGESNRSYIKLKNNSNRSLFSISSDNPYQHVFKKLRLSGNKDNQASGDYIVKVLDRSIGVGYGIGISIEDVYVDDGYGGGVYIGLRRGGSTLSNLMVLNCGTTSSQHGIFINTYDVFMENCHFGNSSGYGICIDNASQIQIFGVNSYHNSEGGLLIGANCTDVAYSVGSFDRNKKYGIYLTERSDTNWKGIRLFSGIRFLGNSTITTNTYSDVFVDGADQDSYFDGCHWQGNAPPSIFKVKYFIEFNNSSALTRVIGSKFNTITPGYGTGLTNFWGCINSTDMPNFSQIMQSDTVNIYKAGLFNALYLNSSNGGVGIGKLNSSDTSLAVSKNITGGSFSYGMVSDGITQSDVTGGSFNCLAVTQTNAGSFTVNSLIGYNSKCSGIGIGSSVSNLIGFNADSTITGGANNYGFRSNISSGTSSWNFYAIGTAPNYFTGTIASLGSYNSTTASAANTFIDSAGLIQRSTSSIRYKSNVETLDNNYSDALLNGVRPVWYRSTCSGDNSGWGWYGFIAEEVAEIDPRLVHWGYPTKIIKETVVTPETYSEDGKTILSPSTESSLDRCVPDTDAPLQAEGVMYDRMVVMLFDIIQRQEKRIVALEKSNESM